jgi:hypothetical protein
MSYPESVVRWEGEQEIERRDGSIDPKETAPHSLQAVTLLPLILVASCKHTLRI